MLDLKVFINSDDPTFTILEPILNSWLHVVREYTNRCPKDLSNPNNLDYCWWHAERPQVGWLAIAAWLNGWAVLEEWGTKKKNGSGRNDLWIGRGQTKLSIEAKQGWCRIDENENKLIQSIEEHLCAAKGSASNLIEDGSKKISAAFISPLWKQTDKADFETARKVWMQKCSKAASAVAMIVPDRDESPRDQRNDFCVGSSLLLDIV